MSAGGPRPDALHAPKTYRGRRGPVARCRQAGILVDHVSGRVAQGPVADQRTQAAGCEVTAVVARDVVPRAGDAHAVVRPAPQRALDRQAERQAGVDVGEGHDLRAAVVPAEAPEQPDQVRELLIEVEVEAVLGAALPRPRDGVVGIQAEICVGERSRLAVGAGEGAVEPCSQSERALPAEGLVAHLQLADIAAAHEQRRVQGVRIRHVGHQEVAGSYRPVRPVQLGGEAPGQSQPVRGIVERAGRPDRPVEEVDARSLA